MDSAVVCQESPGRARGYSTITAKQTAVLAQKESLHESEVVFGVLKQNKVSTNIVSRASSSGTVSIDAGMCISLVSLIERTLGV